MTDEINFDIERMEKAISGESILIPSFLTREEMRWYICATARKEIEIPHEIKHDDILLGEYVKVCYSVMNVSKEKSKAMAKRGRDKIVEENLEFEKLCHQLQLEDPEGWDEAVAWAQEYLKDFKPLD